MRLVIFLLKCLVGLFATIGLLTFASIALVALFATKVDDFRAQRIEVPARIILTLNADGALLEQQPDSLLSRASLGDVMVLREVVAALEAASQDPDVAGLALFVGRGDLGMAQLQELRQAIKRFKAGGKRVFAFAETFGEAGNGTLHYYLGSIADELWLQPSGDIDLTGFHLESPYLRKVLDKFEIEPQIAQREEFKGAMSFLTAESLPEPQRENLQRLLDSWLTQVIRDTAEVRGLEEDRVRALIDEGPHFAESAKAAGLVDRLGYRDELDTAILAFGGEGADYLSLDDYHATHPDTLSEDAPVIALIYGLGPINLGNSENDPVFGDVGLGADSVARTIRETVDDDSVDAIVFRVDSPGGSYVASDTIWREVLRAREEGKPLILSMGNYAASGGYFIAAPAQTIIAQPGTLTGSIGVIGGKLVTRGLFEKFDIYWDGVKAGDNADFWSANKPFDEADWTRIEAWMDRSYEDFLGKVAGGRSLSEEEVRRVAKGQVWTGEDALALGLVDALGGYPEAIAFAKQAAGIDPQTPVRVEQRPPSLDAFESLAKEFLGGSVESRPAGRTLAGLARLYAALAPLVHWLNDSAGDPRRHALRAATIEIAQ